VIGLIRDIPSVQELIERMVAEAEAVRDRLVVKGDTRRQNH